MNDNDIDATDLLQKIKSFLNDQHNSTLKRLAIEVIGDTAVIAGTVSSFYERQLGIECCKRVAGVRAIVDHIYVDPSHESLFSES